MLYFHRDNNNNWRVYNAYDDGFLPKYDWENNIRLRHISTERNLHSHNHRPPVSDVDFQNEVSAYGMAEFLGDANDDWYVEIEHGDVIVNLRNGWGRFERLFDWDIRWQDVICFRIKSSYQNGVLNSKKLLVTRMQSDRILCRWLRLQNIRSVHFYFLFFLKLTFYLIFVDSIFSACRCSEG